MEKLKYIAMGETRFEAWLKDNQDIEPISISVCKGENFNWIHLIYREKK